MIDKMLLSGNEALARGAYEAGVTIGCGYPGTPSTEILENLVNYQGVYTQWSPNEKVALEVAAGACWAGARSVVTMKHVGLNVAADPLMTLSYLGVKGGLAVIVCDDPGMHSSQNEQDTRHYARLGKIPLLEPSDSQEAKDFVRFAMDISERFCTPVIIRSTTRISHSRSLVSLGERAEQGQKPFFVKDPKRFVPVPVYARQMKVRVDKRLEELASFASIHASNKVLRMGAGLGIITSGIAYQYARETFPDASILKLGMSYPFPDKLILDFSETVESLLIVEELDAFLEEHCLALGLKVEGIKHRPKQGELDLDRLEGMKMSFCTSHNIVCESKGSRDIDMKQESAAALPPRPPVLCPGCPHRGIFYELRKFKPVIIGDIGCYSLAVFPPLEAMDTILCMGSGVSSTLGLEKSGTEQKVVGVVGDSTFFHSGMTGLLDIVYNKGTATILVLDNRTTAMTGHQEHPGTGRTLMGEETVCANIEEIARALGVRHVKTIDPYKLSEVRETLKEALDLDEPSVVISRRPCLLLKKTERGRPFSVANGLCEGCGACLKLGCPGLEMEKGKEKGFKVRINQMLCVGCGLCAQICPKDAFVRD
ncbi:indolepyruvate ferredoxin oxidoreductase subunit alpha [bacterium]|nr:indolepyruvate ferredoxin oxidoreductase subunit alpha [bacterium]